MFIMMTMFPKPVGKAAAATVLIFIFHSCCRSVWLRPGVRSFLQAVRPFFEVVLWTAATEDWAERALAELDPTGMLFDHK